MAVKCRGKAALPTVVGRTPEPRSDAPGYARGAGRLRVSSGCHQGIQRRDGCLVEGDLRRSAVLLEVPDRLRAGDRQHDRGPLQQPGQGELSRVSARSTSPGRPACPREPRAHRSAPGTRG